MDRWHGTFVIAIAFISKSEIKAQFDTAFVPDRPL
jgi:hypothetical protein